MEEVEKHVAHEAEQVRRSARTLERSAGEVVDSADRRTELAADRTQLAAERTYAAWVRTGLAALASGVGARALLTHILPAWVGMVTGSMLILFSAFCFAAGVWRQAMQVAHPTPPDAGRIPAPILVGVNGFLIVVDLFALVGVWTAKG